jgi:diacylglycerol O-acyltransferase
MSYNGNLDYGLLGDYDAMPDIDVVADGIEQSLAALLAAARGGRRAAPGRTRRESAAGSGAAAGAPVPIVPPDHSRMRGPAADMRAKREQAQQRSHSQRRKP